MKLNKLFWTRVIPAQAGIQEAANWTPAFAGVTAYLAYFVKLHQPASTCSLMKLEKLIRLLLTADTCTHQQVRCCQICRWIWQSTGSNRYLDYFVKVHKATLRLEPLPDQFTELQYTRLSQVSHNGQTIS